MILIKKKIVYNRKIWVTHGKRFSSFSTTWPINPALNELRQEGHGVFAFWQNYLTTNGHKVIELSLTTY